MLAELANTAGLVNARGAESCAARGGLDVFASAVRAGPAGSERDVGASDPTHTPLDVMDMRYDRSFRDVIRATLSTDLATLESLDSCAMPNAIRFSRRRSIHRAYRYS